MLFEYLQMLVRTDHLGKEYAFGNLMCQELVETF